MSHSADLGMVGLAVMGQNLALNINDHGYTVAGYDRIPSVVTDFVSGTAKDTNFIGLHSFKDLVASLKRPRRVMLMVKAGAPVDSCISSLLPLLDPGDIIIDGGNSYYKDTVRRVTQVEGAGMLYVGTGVSGGEEGARHGPSIMPGGSTGAWKHIRPMFQKISAKVENNTPCCDWIGPSGAGHFVKMVHNGIEYGDMQTISEAYQIMREVLGMDNQTMSEVFGEWNDGILGSYLIEITRDILAYKDPSGETVIDSILDSAGQKGTGKWTAMSALEHGIPLTLIGEAVFARFLSSLKEERLRAESMLGRDSLPIPENRSAILQALRGAVVGAKLLCYTQGFMLLSAASKAYNWNLNFGSIAQLWKGGCIIRSQFLSHIKHAFDEDPALDNLLMAPYFQHLIQSVIGDYRMVVSEGVLHGTPMPVLSSALAFYDGYRNGRGSANMIQAQRDYFGAHTYERVDRPRGEFFHTNWSGTGGSTTAGSYVA